MEAAKPSEAVRRRLADLIGDDRPDPGKLMAELREIRESEHVQGFAALLHVLAHIELPEQQAERLLADLLRHRAEVTRALGRDPGLRVATIDYLSNVKKLLANPTIVERSQLEKTEKSAITDGLTGLYNRRYFLGALGLELRRCQRYGLRLSVLMLDLDGFKALNDRHGHLFGDLVLQRVSRTLRRAVRDADIGARFGGEEFAVLLPETERLGAYVVAERIRTRIEQEFADQPVAGKLVHLTLSGGIGSYPPDGSTSTALLSRADQAMYLAKAGGRNRISLYHSERRANVRYPAKSDSLASLGRRDRAAPAVRGRLLDLSSGGVLLEIETSLAPGTAVDVRFDGRRNAVRPRSWMCPGRVVRVLAARRGVCRVGVAFDKKLPEACLLQQVRRGALLPAVGGSRR